MPNESQEALVMEPDFDAVEDWNWGSSAAKPSPSNECMADTQDSGLRAYGQ